MGSEVSFLYEGLCNFQIQLAKKLDTVPLTRDYISHAETYLRGRDSDAANLRLARRIKHFRGGARDGGSRTRRFRSGLFQSNAAV
jgi:hypothetical protein